MTAITQIKFGISNAFLLQGESCILVDSGPPGRAPRLLRALEQRGVTPGDLSLILHTHAHYDHCGSSAALQQLSGVPVAVHRDEADLLAHGANAPIVVLSPLLKPLERFLDTPYESVTPDVIVEKSLDLNPYGIAGQAIATPGHTPGSLTVLTEEGQALVGDLMGGGWFMGAPFSARPRYHYFATDLAQVRASLQRVLDEHPTTLYVGHGGPLPAPAVARWLETKQGESR